ncbi:DHH family phosphoesterase [Magnetococcus sp. PR-3]|uniref:DHH family phosphoesterase n=1 Tax=Magnetococcus sp. PR-3 TaxID=3120355 RepID=UPI002FCE2058
MNEETITKTEALRELLLSCEGDRHAVVLQDFPDPDAISCGFAYSIIAEAFGIETELIYGGRISHQENIALINLLDLELIQIIDYNVLNHNRYQGAVFVDNQGTTSNLTLPLKEAGVPTVAVMDHHANQNFLTPLFSDLRKIGACASILTSYFMDDLVGLKTSKPEHRRLATALMHGIISDTGAMIEANQQDFEAASYLQPLCDSDMLTEIMHQQRSHRVMEVIRQSLANRTTREGICLSGVGAIRAEDRDAIPQAAEFLLTEETVHTAIVFGLVAHADNHESVQGSLRTTKHSLSPDSFLKEALGQSHTGAYYGGGKAMAGGFEIPLGFLSGTDDPDLSAMKWEAYNAKIRKKFFSKIGVE